jgi:hypothetical protein
MEELLVELDSLVPHLSELRLFLCPVVALGYLVRLGTFSNLRRIELRLHCDAAKDLKNLWLVKSLKEVDLSFEEVPRDSRSPWRSIPDYESSNDSDEDDEVDKDKDKDEDDGVKSGLDRTNEGLERLSLRRLRIANAQAQPAILAFLRLVDARQVELNDSHLLTSLTCIPSTITELTLENTGGYSKLRKELCRFTQLTRLTLGGDNLRASERSYTDMFGSSALVFLHITDGFDLNTPYFVNAFKFSSSKRLKSVRLDHATVSLTSDVIKAASILKFLSSL